jgi:hypothetical protein
MAIVKSEGVTDWAGLWMCVNSEGKKDTLQFDNMERRAIKGITEAGLAQQFAI